MECEHGGGYRGGTLEMKSITMLDLNVELAISIGLWAAGGRSTRTCTRHTSYILYIYVCMIGNSYRSRCITCKFN